MNILLHFGENLRKLAATRGSLTSVATDLGYSKSQFQRLLNANSFPQPHQLHRICEYFGVDARIYLEPLDDVLLGAMQAEWNVARGTERDADFVEAVEYVCPTHDQFNDHGKLVDGIYRQFRRSFSVKGKYFQQLVQVKTLFQSRVIFGYDPRSIYPPNTPACKRKVRGIIHRMPDGYAVPCYQQAFPYAMAFWFMSELASYTGKNAMIGYSSVSRAEASGKNRFSGFYLEHLENGFRDALRVRREDPFLSWDELPFDAQAIFNN